MSRRESGRDRALNILTDYRRPTVIEMMTPHCAECRAMQPDLDAVAAEHADSVDLVVIDASRELAQARALGVRGTPTLIAVRDGVEVARFVGRRSRTDLSELFEATRAGDPGSLPATGRADQTLTALTGGSLIVAGLLVGPSWVLVAIGSALVAWGLRSTVAKWVRSDS